MRVLFDGSRRGRWLTWTAIPVVMGLGALALSSLGSSPSEQAPPPLKPASPARPHFPLAISPDPIVLGVVHPGEQAETSLSLRNTQDKTLIVERIDTSCTCIDVEGVPARLGPYEAAELKVTFGQSDDPGFEGRLSVEVIGYLSGGGIGFRTSVKVEMDPGGGYHRD